MFVGITNTPRDYAWGSHTAIAELLGHEASGGPEAELWLGTHPGSPSRLSDPAAHGGSATLIELTTLPFLLKVLAAGAPLSLQAHPTLEQAAEGFAAENAAGVPIDAPFRNYKDPLHKPELVYALSDEYHALCGFRSVTATRELLQRLGADDRLDALLVRLVDDASLRDTFEWLISRGDGVEELVSAVVELAASAQLSEPTRGVEFEWVGKLADAYPGDPGIVISLLLNLVVLSPGQVLYLPAGNIHAYLSGLGIELMAASDNVLRGGLTPKHVDVPELLGVLDFTPVPVPYLEAERPAPGVEVYRPDVPDFVLTVVTLDGSASEVTVALASEAIILSVSGSVDLVGADGTATIARGDSVWSSTPEASLRLTGSGKVFIATSGTSAA